MPWSWSNPNQSEVMGAQLSAGYKVDAPNIGPVLNAILDYRNQQAQQQQKQFSDALSGISKAAGNISKDRSTGQTADYMSLYQQAQDAGVPGGESEAMRQLYENMSPDAKLAAAKFVNAQQEQALKDQYLQSRTNAADALANQRWTGGTGNPGSVAGPRGKVLVTLPDGTEAWVTGNEAARQSAAKSKAAALPGKINSQYDALKAAKQMYGDELRAYGTAPPEGGSDFEAPDKGAITTSQKNLAAAENRLRAFEAKNAGVLSGGAQGTQTQVDQGMGTRFDSEQAARAAGYKSGEVVEIFDPATKRYRPFQLY